jgi:hypothetical protein
MGKPNRGGLGKPLGWGEGWKGSRSAADSHIFFLAIRREFGGHKNFVLHPDIKTRLGMSCRKPKFKP